MERVGEREYFKDRDGTVMTIVLDSKPATAEDAAKILGVPKSRVKWLKRLAEARTIGSAKTNGSPRLAVTVERKKPESAKRRKHTRGKRKKAAH